MKQFILLDISDSVATITLNRPERHNSLIPELLVQLLAALDEVEANEAVRVLVLRANGRSFSTGGDVKAFYLQRANLAAYAQEIVGLLNDTILRIASLRVPVITAVHGIVTGGSLGFLLASDLVIATPNVTIQPWYAAVGFSPDGGWTAMLPDIIGKQRAKEWLLLNKEVDAETAVSWGLINKTVAPDTLEQEIQTMTTTLATMKLGSLQRTKKLLFDSETAAQRLENERTEFVQQIMTEEALMGMESFLSIAKS